MHPRHGQVRDITVAVHIKTIGGTYQDVGRGPRGGNIEQIELQRNYKGLKETTVSQRYVHGRRVFSIYILAKSAASRYIWYIPDAHKLKLIESR